jgi:hypothetical protein
MIHTLFAGPLSFQGLKKNHLTQPLLVALLGGIVIAFTASWITKYMVVATVNLFLFLIGTTLRRRYRLGHITFMSAGIISDLGLVLTLQITRQAVQTAASFKLSAWNQAHIYMSSAATALYIPMIIIGLVVIRLKRDRLSAVQKQRLHKRLGILTLTFRILGYLLMFTMLDSKPL